MKKLLLITGAIVFIGNITGQRTSENIRVITGGLPDDINQVTEEEMIVSPSSTDLKEYVVKDKICQLIPTSTITVTPEDIKRIPTLTCEPDIVETLKWIGCPGSTIEITESNDDIATKSSTGPFTGLEGHNFIEDPAIIYPNPVRDVLNVKSTDPITVIEILGITGQVEMELDPRSTMDVSTLAAGTYYARIRFEHIKEVQVEKILVVK